MGRYSHLKCGLYLRKSFALDVTANFVILENVIAIKPRCNTFCINQNPISLTLKRYNLDSYQSKFLLCIFGAKTNIEISFFSY